MCINMYMCVYLVLPLAGHDLSIDATDWDLNSINIEEKKEGESREEKKREEVEDKRTDAVWTKTSWKKEYDEKNKKSRIRKR